MAKETKKRKLKLSKLLNVSQVSFKEEIKYQKRCIIKLLYKELKYRIKLFCAKNDEVYCSPYEQRRTNDMPKANKMFEKMLDTLMSNYNGNVQYLQFCVK